MATQQTNTQLKVGFFVVTGVALTMLSILMLGGADSIFKRSNAYTSHFPSVDGLIVGAKVVIGGVTVGAVSKLNFDNERRTIQATLKVERDYSDWIRQDTLAELMTQGVLGDKFVSLSPGAPDKPQLSSGSEIPVRPGKDISQFLSKGDQLMVSLNSIAQSLDRVLKTFETANRSEQFFTGMAQSAKNLASASARLNESLEGAELKGAIRNLNGILEKINNGKGTLGALINDPGLYYDARSLMGGANRNRIVRNLVRQTIKESEEGQTQPDQKK